MKHFIFFLVLIWTQVGLSKPFVALNGAVTSTSPEATNAGVEILKAGGNAADAAVATALTLAVTKAYYGSIGGGGFMMLKFKNHPIEALDYRERAPLQSSSEMFTKSNKKEASITGGLAVATPGVVAGLVALHEKYGKLKWAQVVQPAINLAKKGFYITGEWAEITAEEWPRFSKGARTHYTNGNKKLPAVGILLKQPGLAKALEFIQKKKLKGFYEGPVAKDLIDTVQSEGGILSLEDLKKYKVRWLKPLVVEFQKHKVYLMPPPSSGGIIVAELLQMSEKLDLPQTSPLSADEFHLMGEAMARAFSDRQFLGDPDFNKIPVDRLIAKTRTDQWAAGINKEKKSMVDVKATTLQEGSNTTHYVIVDKEGQTVSATTTVNDDYGSAVVTNKYGINLNNEMDDFTTKPGQPNIYGLIQGEQNKVEPLKTPLSSMSPTIVTDSRGNLIASLGSPGGPRIISAVYQVVYRLLTTDWNMDQAIQAPRVHHQFLPDKLYYDQWGHSPDTLAKLVQKGHTVESGWVAKVYGIHKNKKGQWEAAFDQRGEGLASGY